MSQGIVKVTPRPNAWGTLQLTAVGPDTTPSIATVGKTFDFNYPGFDVGQGQTVECTFDSSAKCTVTRIIQTPKHHGHDAPPVPTGEDAQ
jgi:hypothetical protein